MKARKKEASPIIVTREEMAMTAAEIVTITDRLNTIKLEVKARYNDILEEYEEELAKLGYQLDGLMDAALDWAKRNEQIEFADRKTIDFPRAIVKFHLGNHTVELASKVKTEDVIKLLKAFKTDLADKTKFVGADYVRTKEELNKELIIQDRARLTPETWKLLGIRITQGKSLTVDRKGEQLENKQTIQQAA